MNLPPPPMSLALAANFGSVQGWRDSFAELAQAHGGGAGRVELVFVPDEGTLMNRWAGEAASGAGLVVLALQLPAEAGAFIDRIEWSEAYQRYQDAVHAASEGLGAQHGDVGPGRGHLIDVRRAGVFDAAPAMLPGAVWRDPALVRGWAQELPAGGEVIVYCVYGHEVGRVTAMRLRAMGLNARFLSGGIDGWQAAGRPTVAKGETP